MKENNTHELHDEEYRVKSVSMDEYLQAYSDAVNQAINYAQQDGFWEKIKDCGTKEIFTELQSNYPELFEEFYKMIPEGCYRSDI